MTQKTDHWITELNSIRKHCLTWLKYFLAITLLIYPFNQELYQQLAKPLMLNKPQVIIATRVVSPFTAPLKLILFLAFCLSMPILIWQLWLYLKPAMKKNEQNALAWLLCSGVILYCIGSTASIYWAIPSTIKVFQGMTPDNVLYMPDMDSYLDFAISLSIAFGLSFESPIIIIALVYSGIISLETLVDKRKEAIVLCFLIAMLVTPPDVTSQVLLALPMWLLYEISILLCRMIQRIKA